jgi:hypothetical protein
MYSENGAMIPLGARELARQLLAYEAAAEETSVTKGSTALRAHEKLRRVLCALAGIAGYRSLASRALTLAEMKAPNLRVMQVTADGSLQVHSEAESESDKGLAGEDQIILLAELLGLLHGFIGEELTLRLLREGWPNEVFENYGSGGRKA